MGIDWVDSVWGENAAFKRYVVDGICVHFHIGLWSSDGKYNFGDYCAIIQSFIHMPDRFVSEIARPLHEDLPSISHRLGHCKELMFISGIQLLKEPEMIRFRRLRSYVRLAISDFDKCIMVDSLIEAPLFDNAIVESTLRDKDRKKSTSI